LFEYLWNSADFDMPTLIKTVGRSDFHILAIINIQFGSGSGGPFRFAVIALPKASTACFARAPWVGPSYPIDIYSLSLQKWVFQALKHHFQGQKHAYKTKKAFIFSSFPNISASYLGPTLLYFHTLIIDILFYSRRIDQKLRSFLILS